MERTKEESEFVRMKSLENTGLSALTELSKIVCPRRPSCSTLAVLISELAMSSLLAFREPESELRPASLSL